MWSWCRHARIPTRRRVLDHLLHALGKLIHQERKKKKMKKKRDGKKKNTATSDKKTIMRIGSVCISAYSFRPILLITTAAAIEWRAGKCWCDAFIDCISLAMRKIRRKRSSSDSSLSFLCLWRLGWKDKAIERVLSGKQKGRLHSIQSFFTVQTLSWLLFWITCPRRQK